MQYNTIQQEFKFKRQVLFLSSFFPALRTSLEQATCVLSLIQNNFMFMYSVSLGLCQSASETSLGDVKEQ